MARGVAAGPAAQLWGWIFRGFCVLVLIFLVAPLLVIVPLSFNAEAFFTFTPGMLHLRADAFSLRWYADILRNPQWALAAKNSMIVGLSTTALATALGTLAALGLSRPSMPWRPAVMGILISPMIVPVIIVAAGMYFFYSELGLAQSLLGIIIAHTALGTPFVVITVTATLSGFDHTLTRAAAGLGAGPLGRFFRVILPLTAPGVVSGALFAFATSFDEVVVVMFLAAYDQRTVPLQTWAGVREQISPTILAVASLWILVSVLLMTTIQLLRRGATRRTG